jgi:hypothetical protein
MRFSVSDVLYRHTQLYLSEDDGSDKLKSEDWVLKEIKSKAKK